VSVRDPKAAVARGAALITGARRGIGRAIALELAGLGFDLALADIGPSDDLAETAELARDAGARVLQQTLDVSAIDSHDAALRAIEHDIGHLTCLVNNAGVSVMSRGDLLDASPESFDRCIEVNLRGTFFLTQAFARVLISRPRGDAYRSIVTITSSNVRAVSIARGEYCVSKAGLAMASLLFAVRLANEGIDVFEVQPGIIATEMTAPSKGKYDTAIADGLTAASRWGAPEDVARVVGAMASGALPYTVGHAVPVDGGLLIPRF